MLTFQSGIFKFTQIYCGCLHYFTLLYTHVILYSPSIARSQLPMWYFCYVLVKYAASVACYGLDRPGIES